MFQNRNVWLPIVLMIVFAITRWPGLLPPNFSAAYALVFCAGVYFRNRAGWWVPLGIMLLTDILLNLFYYAPRGWKVSWLYQSMTYIAFAAIFYLGRRFQPQARLASLICGGIVSAILFYAFTNTVSWLLNPFDNTEYTRSWKSWLLAMTLGTGSWPDTWTFFRNTLSSSALFTALFAAAMKYSEHLESAAEKRAANASEEKEDNDTEAQPEEA
jgi:hypothetical protein